jgi:ABC-type methionine transport system ATPase subunit
VRCDEQERVDPSQGGKNKGEFVGILGESGVGKTALLRCINGLTAPDHGEVIMNGDGNPERVNGKRGEELRRIRPPSDHRP